MKQNDLFPRDNEVKEAKKDYEAPVIQIEEVIVEQGYASTGAPGTERDWIHGGELKDGYE